METTKNSKWILIVGYVFVLVLLCLVAFLLSEKPKLKTIPALPKAAFKPQPAASSANTLQTHQEADYSISYPSSVTVSKTNTEANYSPLIFHLPQGPQYFMSLEITSTTISSITSTNNYFKNNNFQESDLLLTSGETLKIFKGTFNNEGNTTQMITAVTEKHNQLYKLQLIYNASQRNQEVDNLFSEILKTLHF